jgi:hypothetical protein
LLDLECSIWYEYGINEVKGNAMVELNPAIIKWINEIPTSDQEALENEIDREMGLLIDLLKEGRDIKRLRDLYHKLSDDLDREEDQP